MTLGQRITAWLDARRLPQTAIADALKISSSAVSHWCADRNPPTQANLESLIELLGTTWVGFYGDIPRKQRSKRAAA